MKIQLGVVVLLAGLALGADGGGCLGDRPVDSECPALLCDLDCANGKATDADGCERCACAAPAVCADDGDCRAGAVCDLVNFCESPPGCRPGMSCPAVCYGRCVKPEVKPAGCWSDTDCARGLTCEQSFCDPAPGCEDGGMCPPVCYGRCVGTPPADEQLCADTGGKWDPTSCGHYACGERPTCKALIPGCACGPSQTFVEGRGCVFSVSCRPEECEGAWSDGRGNCLGPADGPMPAHCCAGQPGFCSDGSLLMCRMMIPDCGPGFVAAVIEGCYQCRAVDGCAAQCKADVDCSQGERCVTRSFDPCGECDPATGPCCASPGFQISVCEEASTCGAMCDMYCEFGNQVGPDGCELCACNEAPSCACDEEEGWAPVCGADGVTYTNACVARCANAPVVHQGECTASCEIRCLVYEPVCGADGVTYGCGAADAACHHTTVAYEGECRPTACRCANLDAPVCGVNGQTYPNPCSASCVNAQIRHEGACGTACVANSECTWGEKCLRPSPNTAAECVAAEFCFAESDCAGLAPTISCVGAFACEEQRCQYRCVAP